MPPFSTHKQRNLHCACKNKTALAEKVCVKLLHRKSKKNFEMRFESENKKKGILVLGLQGNILPASKITAYPTYNSFAEQLEIMRGESIEL